MFSTANLKIQPGRYALIAESILPVIFILIVGSFLRPTNAAGENVVGRPPGIVFGIVWFILVCMWTLALVVTAMDERSLLIVILIGCFSLISLMACLFWLVSYKQNKKDFSAMSLIVATAMMIGCVISSMNGLAPQASKTISSLFYSFIATWLSAATLFNYIEINKQ